MKVGGQIPWNVFSYLRNVTDLLSNAKLSIILLLRRTIQESINLETKSYLDCSLDTLCTWVEFGRVTY